MEPKIGIGDQIGRFEIKNSGKDATSWDSWKGAKINQYGAEKDVGDRRFSFFM